MIFSVHQSLFAGDSFQDDVAGVASAGLSALELRLTKLEKALDSQSARELLSFAIDRGVSFPVASVQGGILFTQGTTRKLQWERFKSRLDLCQAFGVKTLVVAIDFGRTPEPSRHEEGIASAVSASEWAEAFGVRIALEFLGDDPFCASLTTATAVVEACGRPNLGLCVDLFHYYKGSSKPEDWQAVTSENLFHVQLADCAGIPRERMTDADRIFPGEGDFDFGPCLRRLKTIDYSGVVSVEAPNPQFARLKPSQAAEFARRSLESLWSRY